jgi:lipopolysaccharide export system protein LptA
MGRRMKAGAVGLMLLLGVAAAAGAEEPSPPASPTALFQGFSPSPSQPVAIHSDHLQVELGTHRVLFTGHVVAQQTERVIYADQVEATYTAAGELTKLFARGNVKMTAEGALATGDELELDHANATITLRGNPRVVQARQVIRGREMVFHLKEKRLEISDPRIEWMPAETPKPAGTRDGKKP